MRITKTAERVSELKHAERIVNIGCNKCPCCGETKQHWDYFRKGIYDKGLSSVGTCKTWVDGLFRMKHMKCDCYKCYTCGAEWESEPYQWV